jgi:hypothetical protein
VTTNLRLLWPQWQGAGTSSVREPAPEFPFDVARRYGDDLAIVWIDSHPDIGTPEASYPGFHAMAVAALTGHGDADILRLLPATVSPVRGRCSTG